MVLDILPSLYNTKPEIFTQTIDDKAISWRVFLDPLSHQVWIYLLLVAMLISFILTFIEKKFNLTDEAYFVSYLKNLWISIKANIGGKPSSQHKNGAHQTVLFTCLSIGVIIWMAFRASMTSVLSVNRLKLPFHDFESLHTLNFK